MLLQVEKLTVSLRESGRALLDRVSFEVDAGQSLQVLGLSGSGKTTLCNALLNALDRNAFSVSGEMRYDGSGLTEMGRRGARRLYGAEIVYIPQNPMTAFDPSMRIGRQLAEVLAVHRIGTGRRAEAMALDALKAAHLEDAERVYRSYPCQLSGGMLQRALISMAMMTRARLVIADEPTTALDTQLRAATIASLNELKQRGAAVLMMTHDLRSALRLGGMAAVLQEGRLVEEKPTERLFCAPEHPHTRALIAASTMEESA